MEFLYNHSTAVWAHSVDSKERIEDLLSLFGKILAPAAGFPAILRIVGTWVRKLLFLGFLSNFTIGK